MVRRSTLVGLSIAVAAAAVAVLATFRLLSTDDGGGAISRSPYLAPGAEQCTNFLFRLGNVDVKCVRTGARDWTTTSYSGEGDDLGFRAGEETVRRFLDALATTPVQDRISREELLRRGFAPQFDDAAEITLFGPTTTILLVATNVYDGCVCARVIGEGAGRGDEICVVRDTLLDVLPRSALAFRDNRLFPSSDIGIGRMELRFESDDPVFLFRQPSGWFVHRAAEAAEASPTNRAAMPSLPADREEVVNLLVFLAKLRFRDPQYDVDPSDRILSELHCAPSSAASSLRLWPDPSEIVTHRAHEYYFGPTTSENGSAVPVYIQDERLLAFVDRTVPLSLNGGPERFRNHHILPERQPESLAAIRIRPDRGTATLFRREGADDSWRMSLPVSLEIDTGLFSDFLKVLFSLSDDGLAPLPVPAAEGGGPGSALATIEWTFSDGGAVTARVDRVAGDDGCTLWSLSGESRARVVPVEHVPQSIVPWDESFSRRLVRPEIPGASVVALAPDSVAPYGLLTPEEALLDRNEDGGTPVRVRLGDASPSGGRYAMLSGGYVVYDLPPDRAALLRPVPAPPSQQEPLP